MEKRKEDTRCQRATGTCMCTYVVNVLSKSALSGYYRPRPLPVINYGHVGRFFQDVARLRANPCPLFRVISCTTSRFEVSPRRMEAERASIPGQRANELLCITLHASATAPCRILLSSESVQKESSPPKPGLSLIYDTGKMCVARVNLLQQHFRSWNLG